MVWGALGELENAVNRAPRDHCPVVRRVVVDGEDRGVSHQHQSDPVAWQAPGDQPPERGGQDQDNQRAQQDGRQQNRRAGTLAPDGA